MIWVICAMTEMGTYSPYPKSQFVQFTRVATIFRFASGRRKHRNPFCTGCGRVRIWLSDSSLLTY